FRQWLTSRDYRSSGGLVVASRNAIDSAIGVLTCRAQEEGQEHCVFLRVGEAEGKIYLDLCDREWRAIEISSDGWRIVNKPSARLIRSRCMQPLPVPVSRGKGSLDPLWPLLNVRPDHRSVVAGFLLSCLRPTGPYWLGNLFGIQGSAKS